MNRAPSRTSRPSVPPWRSSSHRSGQSVSVCSVDGESVTMWSSPFHNGASVGQRRHAVPLDRVGARDTGLLRAAPVVLPRRPGPLRRRRPALRTPPRAAGRPARTEPAPEAHGSVRAGRDRDRWPGLPARSRTATAASTRRHCRRRPRSPAGGCGRGPWRRSAACVPRPAMAPCSTIHGRTPLRRRRSRRRAAGCPARRRAERCWATTLPAGRR